MRGVGGKEQTVEYRKDEELPAAFKRLPNSRLQAFDTRSERGWGVRSTAAITEGTFVIEVCGRCVDAAEALLLENLESPDEVQKLPSAPSQWAWHVANGKTRSM